MIRDHHNDSLPDRAGFKQPQLGLTSIYDIGAIASRTGKRVDLVARLLQEDSTTNDLTAEHMSFPSGTLGKFGGVECSWCPAGRFMMGSPESEEGRQADEIQHIVTLTKGFWMSCWPVIQHDYQAVVGSNPSCFTDIDCPVEHVSWDEAVEYCRKLTVKQRSEGILPFGWEWRLPTEAEWEYAARAGTTGARHGELETIAWHRGNSGGETHPVSQKAANAWGLKDMIGNVLEWWSDWYGDDPSGSVTDPTGPSLGSDRVVRGGSWGNVARGARSANRFRCDPGNRFNDLGFRPAFSSVR